MSKQQSQQQQGIIDHKGAARNLYWVFQCLTAAGAGQGDIFWHHDLGRMWPPLGVKLLIVCLPGIWMCVYGAFLNDDLPDAFWNVAPLWPLVYANIGLIIIHSVTAARREPGEVHRISDGTPWLYRLFPSLEELEVKRIEIKLTFVLAALACFVSVPLGGYMLFVAFSSAYQMDLERWRLDREMEGMADGQREAAIVMDRMER